MAFEHPIEWTDENVSRLWDYYSRTPPYLEDVTQGLLICVG